MDLRKKLMDEFIEDFERYFLSHIETIESTVETVLKNFTFDIGMEINDLFSFQESKYLLSKLKSEMYASRNGRKNRLMREIQKNASVISAKYNKNVNEILEEVDIWNNHPYNIYLTRAPYFSEVLTFKVAYNNLVSDMTLFLYNYLTTVIENSFSDVYTFPQNVHDIVSISTKTSIKPMEYQSLSVPTSTTTFQFPSSMAFNKAIKESMLSDYKDEAIQNAWKGIFVPDIEVFGFICSKVKMELFNNEFKVKIHLKDMVKSIYGEYRKEYEENIITSLVKLTLVKIYRNSLIMGFLTNLSYTSNESGKFITTILDSDMAEQIKKNQAIQLDQSIYNIVKNDMAKALILPIQTYRFKEYLAKKNKSISQKSLKIDWIWVSKHLSVPMNSRPSVVMDRIETALVEFDKKHVLIDRYVKQNNTFLVYLMDISNSEEYFIKKHYIEKDIIIGDSILSLT